MRTYYHFTSDREVVILRLTPATAQAIEFECGITLYTQKPRERTGE